MKALILRTAALLLLTASNLFSQSLREKIDFVQMDITEQFKSKKASNYTINYDKNGNISDSLPNILFKNDKISIKPLGDLSEFKDIAIENKVKSIEDSLLKYKDEVLLGSHYLLPKLFDYTNYLTYCTDLISKLKTTPVYTQYELEKKWIPCCKEPNVLLNKLKSNELKIQIIKPNLKWHFDSTYLVSTSKYKFQDWEKFKPTIKILIDTFNLKAKVIDSLITKLEYDIKIGKNSFYPRELMYNLLKLEDTRKDLDEAITKLVIEPNKEILKASLLLTGPNPSFNPLGLPDASLSSSISKSKSLIEVLEKQIKDRQAANVKSHPPIDSDNLKKLEELHISLDKEKKKLAGFESQLTAFNNFKVSLKNNGTILNEIKFYLSDSSEINWMRHYCANNNIEIKNDEKLIPGLISDIDQIRPIVHNIPKGIKVFSTETVKGYEVKTPFADVVDKMFKQISDPNLLNIDLSLINKTLDSFKIQEQKDSKSGKLSTLDTYELLRNYLQSKKLKEWFENIKIPMAIELPKTFSMDTLMRSEWVKQKHSADKKGANEINYSIKTNNGKTTDTLELSKKYKTYDLKRTWPFAGIAYVPSPRNTSVFDAATNTFVSNPNPEQLDILVGVKFYPFKGFNQTRTPKSRKQTDYGFPYKYLRGNSFINSVSVSGSLSVRYKFLRNYFLGVGFDIIPGLNLQVGGNMYFQNRYELENGKLVKASERPLLNRGYFALTTDVSILGKFVKFINPF